MLKIIIFTEYGAFLPVALKLKKEGNDVIVGQIVDQKLTLTKEEKNGAKAEDAEMKKRRLALYDGILDKTDAVKLLKSMKKIDPNGYYILTDSNNTFQFTEVAQKMGFTGLLPDENGRTLEVDREKGKEIVKEHYPDISMMDYHEFKTIEEGIEFLQDNENVYCLKSQGDQGDTVVAKIDDPAIANQQIIDTLQKDKASYEANGYILEQKILNAIELTPQAVFWNGKMVYTNLDIETKTMGGHELGYNVGCGMNLVLKTDVEDKLNKIAFPPYVHDLAKQKNGMFIVDAGLLFDNRTGKAYFTEFCYQRFGWDCLPAELAMADSATSYFEKIFKGKNPLVKRFGVGIRLFNFNKDSDRYPKADMSISCPKYIEKCLYLYDTKKEDEKIVTVGFQEDLGVITAASDTMEDIIKESYEYAQKIGFKDLYYRSHEDFISTEYPQAILNRLKYAVEKKLIKDDGILEEIGNLTQFKDRDTMKTSLSLLQNKYDKLYGQFNKNKELLSQVKQGIKDALT